MVEEETLTFVLVGVSEHMTPELVTSWHLSEGTI